MYVKSLKYLSPIIMYFLAIISFNTSGIICWITIITGFIFIPALEIFIKPNTTNLTSAEEDLAKQNNWYDYFLYLIVLLQVPTVFYGLYQIKYHSFTTNEVIAKIATIGFLCGTFGINVGHELGHRKNKAEQWMAKILLMTSLYMHFFVEHNKGHHKNVATPEDPSSARYGELIYTFYFRTIVYSYLSAWHIANEEMKKQSKSIFSINNEMIQIHLIQFAFLGIIFACFGSTILLYFLACAFIGILLLETVNYIEHYGLQRNKSTSGNYERAMPYHSWNSNHVIGRIILFELSRHSDHHYLASRKYQVLQHHHNAPQMPTGYPGMMLLSLVPPLWFIVMNKRVKAVMQNN